jgi:superfamily II DNA or RNA helicase
VATKELNSKLIEESKRTIEEALDGLNEYGKIFVCRPTGFGKTYMLIQIAKEYRNKYPDKRIAYIYPLNIIPDEISIKYGKNSDDKDVRDTVNESIDFISYSELTRKSNANNGEYWSKQFKDKYSILLLDEVHSSGSEGFRRVYDDIKELIGKESNQIRMIGVTATPNRMDDVEGETVLDSIFDGHKIYDYNLANCIIDGILLKPIIGTYKYNMKELAEELKAKMKVQVKSKGLDFDEESFNVELSKIIKDNGTEGEFIYKYLEMAGYNLTSSTDKYYKFIVFMNNIADVAERGPEVESWFSKAFNEVAKKKLNLKKEFLIRSHYLTSSDTEENEIDNLVKNGKNRFKYNNTQKLARAELKDKYVVDVILTVNMTNMGYHDEDITGVLMLRGTRSEIIYYQQLGRAISVTSEHNPLIYDFVNNVNTKFWSKKDRQREIAKSMFGPVVDSEGREKVDYENLMISVEGDYDAGEDFLNRWSDVYYSEKAKLIYLYEDRKCPIVAISADTGKKCAYIAKTLIQSGIELRPEDAMYIFESKILKSETKTNEDKANAAFVMKYLYSKAASEHYKQLKGTDRTLYTYIKKESGH